VPFLTLGGAEKFILQVLEALQELDPKRSLLVICGQAHPSGAPRKKLQIPATVVDLDQELPNCQAQVRELICFRLLEAVCSGADLHIKSCEFANSFLKNYHRRLKTVTTNFYLFCENAQVFRGAVVEEGFNFETLSQSGTSVARIISDHQRILDDTHGLLDGLQAKLETVYGHVRTAQKTLAAKRPPRSNLKLAWASRLDPQKRPDLLGPLSRALARRFPKAHLHIYGSAILSQASGQQGLVGVQDLENVTYHGGFDSFDCIAAANYDAFIYTSLFDGLPNILLEAIAADLIVIAPDIGGIRELISNQTGYLIPHLVDDQALISSYLDAVAAIIGDPDECLRRRINARQLVERRHSKEAHRHRIASVFGLSLATQPK